jgi:hypothetical protein
MGLLKKAENQMAFFKAGLLGFPGSGKTFTASLLGIGVCHAVNNTKLAFFDTETGSDFLLPKLKNEGIETYQWKGRAFSDLLKYIKECEDEKVGVLIIDSITHVWRDLCESYDKKLGRKGRLQFQDWATIKGEWKQYTDLFVNSQLHIIVCGRAGYEYDYDYNEDGTKDLIKTDIKMKVESEFGFEPSLVILMERTSENKEEIKEYLGKTDRKSKEAKQMHKPSSGSKWIHRAYILKDRTDTINGQTFDYPKFDDFLPHFHALNIGGHHLGVDTSRTSEDRFNKEGQPLWKQEKTRAAIALEEIKAEVEKVFPGTTKEEKKAKILLAEYVFMTSSPTAIEGMSYMSLELGLQRIKSIISVQENVKTLLSGSNKNLLEPDPETELPQEQTLIPEEHSEKVEV